MVYINKEFLISCFYLFLSGSYYHIWLYPRLMHHSSDIEKNPVSKKSFSQTLCIGHYNLNCLVAHNFTKVALLKAYLSVKINETSLDSDITEDDRSF